MCKYNYIHLPHIVKHFLSPNPPFYWYILRIKATQRCPGLGNWRHIYLYEYGVICFTVSGPSPHRSFSINSTNRSKSS
jgi:hypothetical protein